MRKLLALIVFCLLFVLSAGAADLNYPYGNVYLKLPPQEDPLHGMGSHYSALGEGLKTVLWNPASLSRIKLSETLFYATTNSGQHSINKNFKVSEMGNTFKVSQESTTSAGQYGIFFRAPANIGQGISTKEVQVAGNLDYATTTTGLNFGSAIRVNNWLVLGFTTNNPIEGGLSLGGNFPTTTKALTNLYGQTIGEMQIADSGKLTYRFNSGGTVTTYESTRPLWSGFISQEAIIPLTSLTDFSNSFNVHPVYTGTIASDIGRFHLGLNFMPINASANITNRIQTIVNPNTADIFLNTPNLDPNNQADIANWITDPDKYGTSAGYLKKNIQLPAGEIIGESIYQGYYNASAMRLDLGGIYDVNDWFAVGFDLENFGGAALDFRGTGLSSYISYRNPNTAEVGNLENILSPGGQQSFNLFPEQWVTTSETGGTHLVLEDRKTYNLPRRIRFGFTLKRPILLAVDYEQNLTSIVIPGSNEASNINISGLNYLRLGGETQLFKLPFWLRGGTVLAFKPSISGANADIMKSIDTAFKFGVLPLRFDLGSTLKLWDLEIFDSFGFNAQPLLHIFQVDTANLDITKTLFVSAGVKKDPWEINFLSVVDPVSTAAAYQIKPNPSTGSKQFEFTDVRYTQTIGVTYKF